MLIDSHFRTFAEKLSFRSVRHIFFEFYELTELTPPFPQLDEIRDTDFYAYYRQW